MMMTTNDATGAADDRRRFIAYLGIRCLSTDDDDDDD